MRLQKERLLLFAIQLILIVNNCLVGAARDTYPWLGLKDLQI
jgi:hypothetical protein